MPHAWSQSGGKDFDGNPPPRINDIPFLYGNSDAEGEPYKAERLTYLAAQHATNIAIGRSTAVKDMVYTALKGVRLDGQRPDKVPTSFIPGFMLDLVAEHINVYTGSPSARISHLKGLILSETLDSLVPRK